MKKSTPGVLALTYCWARRRFGCSNISLIVHRFKKALYPHHMDKVLLETTHDKYRHSNPKSKKIIQGQTPKCFSSFTTRT